MKFLLRITWLICFSTVHAQTSPNVIIIFADDQGYQDLSCFGSKTIDTPNIDRIAKDGCRFTSFYSAYSVCSASRASLLTGCYAPRLSMPGVIFPDAPIALNPDEFTIADMLQAKGYATQCVGKWHVGDSPETLPTAQGFDHYFGYPYSNDMELVKGKSYGRSPKGLDKIWKEKDWNAYEGVLLQDTTVIEQPVNQTTLTDRYGDECVKFIESNTQKPFFLYFASSMPHVPLFVSDERYDPDPKKAYKLTIEHIDSVVGRILASLDQNGLTNNTLVIYTSDNGPWLEKEHHAGSALPLRAGKMTTYEGGVRVPCVMRLPGTIQPGSTSDSVAATIDLLPTIATLTNAKLSDHTIDGHDITQLLNDPSAKSPHDESGFFYYNRSGKNHSLEAVRMGPWKLRVTSKRKAKGDVTELYNLDQDISESTNLAASHPEIVKRLRLTMKRHEARLQAEKRPAWTAKK